MSFRLEVAISRCRNFEIGSFYVFCCVVFLFCYWWKSTKLENPSGLPVIGRRWYEIGYGKASERFRHDCLGLVRSCLEKKLVNGVPGFEPMESMTSSKKIIHAVTKHSLNRNLGTFIEPLNEESNYALDQVWTDDPEFHEVMLKDSVWKIFGRIMSRTFINDRDFYRNPEWVNASSEYVELSALAGYELRAFPKWAKCWVAPFLPNCRKLQSLFKHINKLLEPLKEKLDQQPPGVDSKDPLSFLYQKTGGRLDELASMLIALCLVSYDGGGELFTHVLHSVFTNSQLVNDLRAEIVTVIGKEGFNKNTLQNLVLMDSVLKEVQRMHPESVLMMQRIALEEVVLPDGLIIPKGTALFVSACHIIDASVWPEGDKFDGYRFFNLRRKGKPSTSQVSYNFTSTSPDHFSFGHGSQACPGRFFASYMQKILLCNILMRYDVSVTIPDEGAWFQRGQTHVAHPGLKARVRRRKEEIEL
ncbi:cytochrome P450, putative [Talaromyces stipitatus ATCC 10500]|uniref:Cytochrome P450, putative n=1 Tax=Talaromyces stipitatus (strain ATCC 10500 / CBS 375.48 / QM 6759 / NRRL 1006) TaxID=441959 RepID=B8M913_TALSN|nr:cytochrome P450, putative [Talaromyces stipitatus ATCC 10500]EED17308.1 cytochrome P450, putative [Talaromyces stipitatus ATCC 10500]